MFVKFDSPVTFEGKQYEGGEEALLNDEAVAALGDSVTLLERKHQFGEKPAVDAPKEEGKTGAAMTPGFATKDLDGAPNDAMVKSAPKKK